MQNTVVLKEFGICYVKMHDFNDNPLYDSQKWGYAYKINRI